MKNLWCLLFCGVIVSASSCALMEPVQEIQRETVRMFRPKTSDYRDSTQDEIDEWESVGREARGDQPFEHDPDPWWQNYIMSPKARSIERNLGID